MKRHLPFALTTLRLLLGPIALACALAGVTRFVFLPILAVAWRLCQPVIAANLWLIALMLLSEAGGILICLVRFGKFPATHSWLAKFYGLCLLAGLIALLAFNAGSWAIITLAVVALVTNTEIIAMHLIAKSPPVDVPGILILLKRQRRAK